MWLDAISFRIRNRLFYYLSLINYKTFWIDWYIMYGYKNKRHVLCDIIYIICIIHRMDKLIVEFERRIIWDVTIFMDRTVMEAECYQFSVRIGGALLPQAAINHLWIFILIRTISVSRLIQTKNLPQRRQSAIKKPQLQYSHPALNIYHTKNKYKNNQIKSFASFRSIFAGLKLGLLAVLDFQIPILRPETPVCIL